jgi:hypothetical protein
LYLRRVMFEDGYHYLIRTSYREGEYWKSRDLVDLGADPADHIEYAGGNGFYFNPEVEEELEARGVKYSTQELEGLFLPFLPSRMRRIIESFQTHTTRRHGSGTGCREELSQQQRNLHSFDKRRLHFLRCGRVDIGELDGRPWKFLDVLTEKSRDEIEHVIEGMECVLRPHEMRPYLFTALRLQSRFPHHLLCNQPAALDQNAVDEHFMEALCSLNTDETYFAGIECPGRTTLHPYLLKYLILYFDSEFQVNPVLEKLRSFIYRQKSYGSMPGVRHIPLDDACKLLGINRQSMMEMDRKQLVRLYRQKAKELHPDQGGDKESFILMREAFVCVMEGKS